MPLLPEVPELGLPVMVEPPPFEPLLPGGALYAWLPLEKPPLFEAAEPLTDGALFDAATPPPVPELLPAVAYGAGCTLL